MGVAHSLEHLVVHTELEELAAHTTNENVNACYFNPLLYTAVWHRNVAVVRWLIDNFPTVDINQDGGPPLFRQSPLYLAVSNDSLEIATALLQHPEIDPNKGLYGTPLLKAIATHNLRMVELLLAFPRVSPNVGFGYTPLTKAIYCRNTAALEQLLQHSDLRLSNRSGELLFYALNTTALPLLGLLLSHPQIELNIVFVDPEHRQQPPCHPLAKAMQLYSQSPKDNGVYWEMLVLLVQHPHRIDTTLCLPLHLCALWGLCDIYRLLLEHHPELDPHQQDTLGRTAATVALEAGHLEICHQIDPNVLPAPTDTYIV
eukprot:NODE_2869_length_1076_cov_32.737619_g2737_i0.p1 GENE.NODE_2869_length_1076_cov_32.737619_g2737_i0~~NODE_2869_length_1076_cov_32.737619_g2737_i0.p1  ORF type:complete len:315 (+),score=88.42 NODE_2869_length_1076_cov_32.737619_g2737_i0:77-1021(+)